MSPQKPANLNARFKEYSRYTEIRQLAYNIATQQQERRFKSLAVLSFSHGEGKTLFSVALAMAYAETCRSRVLVVDTAQRQSPGALILKDCFSASESDVDITELADWRSAEEAPIPSESSSDEDEEENQLSTLPAMDNDYAMISRVASAGSKRYGLILLDTVPLTTKNKSNVDPLLVARLAGASVLVVSQKLLNAPRLEDRLKMADDPSLHLIGMIANEEFES
jgi:hypothetical protein